MSVLNSRLRFCTRLRKNENVQAARVCRATQCCRLKSIYKLSHAGTRPEQSCRIFKLATKWSGLDACHFAHSQPRNPARATTRCGAACGQGRKAARHHPVRAFSGCDISTSAASVG